MSKNSKAELAAPPSIAAYIPPTRIRVNKDQASEIAIGEKVTITVTGSVVAIQAQKDYRDGKDVINGYEIELDKSSVTDISGNPAEKAIRDLKGK